MRTNTSVFVLPAMLLTLVLAACQPAGQTEEDRARARAQIETAIEDWIAAFNRQDLDAVVAAHSEDVISSFANEPDLRGRDELRDLYQGMFQRPGGDYTFDAAIEEIETSCDMAYVRVIWTLTWHPEASSGSGETPEPRVLRKERAMELWRKEEDGRWHLARWLGYEVDREVPAVDTPEESPEDAPEET